MIVPSNIVHKKLYIQAKQKADATYKRHSAYKSMYIVSTYKKLGGKYIGSKTNSTTRWNDEQWIQVIPYLTKGIKRSCGSSNKKTKVCRPCKRVNKSTPITLPELIKLHSKKNLLSLARKKNKDMNGRVYWKTLRFISSKK